MIRRFLLRGRIPNERRGVGKAQSRRDAPRLIRKTIDAGWFGGAWRFPGPALAGLWVAILFAGCATRTLNPPAPVANAAQGETHFKNYCSACHLYDDQGMGDAPPLDGTIWVTGPEERLIRIVLHGIRGPMEIQGRTYNREMPGFGQILSDNDIASLLTFVRERFGGPEGAITAATVGRVRAANADRTTYWSVEELLAEQ